MQAVVEVDERPLRPQPFLQLLTRDDAARARQQHVENEERLLLQADASAVGDQFARVVVECDAHGRALDNRQ